MEITYYTIDDLRLQPGRPFQQGWTMEQFPTLREALARYRTFPAHQTRSIGITDGIHVLELARCLPIYPEGVNGADVQAAVPDVQPGDYAAGAIYDLYAKGILAGTDGGFTFSPNASITRAEAAAMAARLARAEQRLTLF